MKFVNETEQQMKEFEERYDGIFLMAALLDEYQITLNETDKVKLIELKQAMSTLKALMATSDETIEKSTQRYPRYIIVFALRVMILLLLMLLSLSLMC